MEGWHLWSKSFFNIRFQPLRPSCSPKTKSDRVQCINVLPFSLHRWAMHSKILHRLLLVHNDDVIFFFSQNLLHVLFVRTINGRNREQTKSEIVPDFVRMIIYQSNTLAGEIFLYELYNMAKVWEKVFYFVLSSLRCNLFEQILVLSSFICIERPKCGIPLNGSFMDSAFTQRCYLVLALRLLGMPRRRAEVPRSKQSLRQVLRLAGSIVLDDSTRLENHWMLGLRWGQ